MALTIRAAAVAQIAPPLYSGKVESGRVTLLKPSGGKKKRKKEEEEEKKKTKQSFKVSFRANA